jgi:hypothetical protein
MCTHPYTHMHTHTNMYTHLLTHTNTLMLRERYVWWVPKQGLFNAEELVLFVQLTDKWRNRARSFLPTWWSPRSWYQHKEGIPLCVSHRLSSHRWAVALHGHMLHGCKVTVGSFTLLTWLTLFFWRWRYYIPMKHQWTYTTLHDIHPRR